MRKKPTGIFVIDGPGTVVYGSFTMQYTPQQDKSLQIVISLNEVSCTVPEFEEGLCTGLKGMKGITWEPPSNRSVSGRIDPEYACEDTVIWVGTTVDDWVEMRRLCKWWQGMQHAAALKVSN